jgi:hypothetical protein
MRLRFTKDQFLNLLIGNFTKHQLPFTHLVMDYGRWLRIACVYAFVYVLLADFLQRPTGSVVAPPSRFVTPLKNEARQIR